MSKTKSNKKQPKIKKLLKDRLTLKKMVLLQQILKSRLDLF
ncbi:MAG: hypothetical protein KR126chlam3_00524 [Chlamydiae bacterium]|nr:hypothetical protein [Chlamydiota bacterium]